MKYFVVNEHTLCYHYDDRHLTRAFYSAGILAKSVIKGSPYDRLQTTIPISPSMNIRPATARDFQEFGVSLPPDFNEEAI